MEAQKEFDGLTNEELLTEYRKTGELSLKQELVAQELGEVTDTKFNKKRKRY